MRRCVTKGEFSGGLGSAGRTLGLKIKGIFHSKTIHDLEPGLAGWFVLQV